MKEKETTTEELLKQVEELRSRLSRVESERHEVTSTFSMALEQGSAAVYRRNFDSNVYKYMGEGIKDITGYSSDIITPAIWDEMIISVENKGELEGLTLDEANRRVREGEVDRWLSDTQLRTKSGEIRWVTDMSTVLRDSSGKCYGCLGILYDITVRKQAEQELARTSEELRKKNEEMQKDLNMAREVQMALIAKQYRHFPHDLPVEQSALLFNHQYLPTSTLAGDFFSIFPISKHKIGIFICDVMGHGARASLLTAYIRGLIVEIMPIAADSCAFIKKLNVGINTIMTQYYSGIYATAFYLVADIKSGCMHYTNAGHPSPFVLKRSQGTVEHLHCNGKEAEPALGMIKEFDYSVFESEMTDGDTVFLFTDGMFEVMNKGGDMFGKKRLFSLLHNQFSVPPDKLIDRTLEGVHDFIGSEEFSDDVCLVTMHVKQAISRQ